MKFTRLVGASGKEVTRIANIMRCVMVNGTPQMGIVLCPLTMERSYLHQLAIQLIVASKGLVALLRGLWQLLFLLSRKNG